MSKNKDLEVLRENIEKIKKELTWLENVAKSISKSKDEEVYGKDVYKAKLRSILQMYIDLKDLEQMMIRLYRKTKSRKESEQK